MSPATNSGRSRSVTCRRGGLALALVATFIASSLEPGTWLHAQPATLPPDLAAVPAEAMMVAQVRVADLWNGDLGKSLRKHGGKVLDEVFAELEKKDGLGPGDIERVTIALMLPNGISGDPAPVVLITTTKAYSQEKIMKALALDVLLKHKGKTYYTVAPGQARSGRAVAFLNERLVVLADPAAMRLVLEREPGTEVKGRLGAALRLLAASKHHVHSVTDPSSIIKEIPKDLPPEVEPFKPLLKTQLLTQSVNLGKDIRIEMALSFANADEAKAGAKALDAALDMVRPLIAQALPEIEQSVAKEMPELSKAVKAVVAALDKLKAEQTGAEVKIALRVDVNVAEVVAALVPAVQKVRTAASRMASQNNLKQIALALINHESAYRSFPPHAIYGKDGKPLLSWRVAILPFIEEDALYKEFKLDEPWDSPHNKKLLARMPKTYALVDRPTKEPYTTFYQVFTGANTLFDGPKGMRIIQIRDGSSNTLMVVEAGEAVPWTKPEDIAVDPKKPLPKLGGLFPELPTFNAAFCDGSVRAISKQVKEMILRALITPAGGEVVNVEDLDK